MTDTPSPLNVTLFFDHLPTIDPQKLAAAITRVERVEPVQVEVFAETEAGSVTQIVFRDHRIQLVGIDAPLPLPVYEPQLFNAHLRPEDKPLIQAHRAHMIAYYEGDSPLGVEKIIALYTVAYALKNPDLRGIFCPQTWMIQTPNMLPDLMSAESLSAFRDSPASMFALWLGYVKFARPDGHWWLVTKGGELFGVPNFAYLVKNLGEANNVVNLFGDIITYLYKSGKKMAVGHTMQVGDFAFRLREVYEYPDYIGADTLVIQRT